MKNLPKETIFQLKSLALNAATATGQENVVGRAEEIYEWLTVEVPSKGDLVLVEAPKIV